MPKQTCCVWCWKTITVPDNYNDLQHKGVCSPKCAKAERWFCRTHSDEHIGLRYYKEYGVNPNHRGGGDGKTSR